MSGRPVAVAGETAYVDTVFASEPSAAFGGLTVRLETDISRGRLPW